MGVPTKAIMANERTYLEWIHMAVTIGGIGSGLLTFSTASTGSTKVQSIGERTASYIGSLMIPLAIVYALYAVYQYLYRYRQMRDFQFSNLQSEYAPGLLGG